MKTDPLYTLAQIVLPSEVLNYFDIVNIESHPAEIYIYLDEKMFDSFKDDVHFDSKGFMNPISIIDFPIRNHKVIWWFVIGHGQIIVQANLFYTIGY